MTSNEVADFSFGGIWGIIMLLIVAGLFSGGGFGFGNNNAVYGVGNDFLTRDIFSTNTSVLTSANDTQNLVNSAKYDIGSQIQQNRYDNALGVANINQNILLGNQNLAALLESCCCDIKTTVRNDGEQTRALITQNRMADLEKELANANVIISNQQQTQSILSSLGKYVPTSSTSA